MKEIIILNDSWDGCDSWEEAEYTDKVNEFYKTHTIQPIPKFIREHHEEQKKLLEQQLLEEQQQQQERAIKARNIRILCIITIVSIVLFMILGIFSVHKNYDTIVPSHEWYYTTHEMEN